MEENTRQRAGDISEIETGIDATTAVTVTTEGPVHLSRNLCGDITVPAISDPVPDANQLLTDNILRHEIADFSNTGEDFGVVNAETSNSTNLLEGNKTDTSYLGCSVTINETEPIHSDESTATIFSQIAEKAIKQELIESVKEITSMQEKNLIPSKANNLEHESRSGQVNFEKTNPVILKEKPTVLGLTSEDEENFMKPLDDTQNLSSIINNVEQEIDQQTFVPITVFNNPIKQVSSAWSDFKNGSLEGFTKGCKWSPDGLCLLTNSEDNALRIFELPPSLQRWRLPAQMEPIPEMRSVLRMPEGGVIYDYCWYPLMSSSDPATCCLASTAQNNPVHLWDAYDGSLRASYRAYNDVDEVEAATSVAFSPSGERIYCGFKNVVRVFDTAIPGRDCDSRVLKDRKVADSQRGIVSCISVNPADPKIFAVGTYLKSIGIYEEGQRQAVAYLLGHAGGLTQLTFAADGTRLFSGGRRDGEIICWDLRNSAHVLYTMQRQVTTNQRIQFDLTADGNFLVSGGTDGTVTLWDLNVAPEWPEVGDPVLPVRTRFLAHADCANGVSVHDRFPVLATSSGQRHFRLAAGSSSESLDSDGEGSRPRKRAAPSREDCVKLWWTGAYE